MPAFRGDKVFLPAVRNGPANQLFADAVARGGVKQVNARIESSVQELGGNLLVSEGQLKTDPGQADPQMADAQTSPAKRSIFHGEILIFPDCCVLQQSGKMLDYTNT
jgi:hypothetical protein